VSKVRVTVFDDTVVPTRDFLGFGVNEPSEPTNPIDNPPPPPPPADVPGAEEHWPKS